MAEPSTLARPYAKAIFELARDSKQLADWSALVGGLAAAVRDPKVAAAIGHPAIGRGQLADVLIQAMGKSASAETRNLLRLLSDYNRLKLAPVIAQQFEQLRAEFESRIDVEITSATAVDGAQKEKLVGAIRKRLNRDVDIQWKTDEKLIAGAVVRAGDLVIDGSVAGELEQLRTALTA
jgi:F-type H+-transporting ATPase subunit delta